MRRITTWALSTVSALVLLFSYHTSTSSTAAGVVALGSANTGGGGASSTGGSTPDPTAAPGSSGTPTPSESSSGTSSPEPGATTDSGSTTDSTTSGSGGGSASGTYTGDAVMTRFGAVQVEISVANGKIEKSVVTQVPWNGSRDQQINSYAVPILNEEAARAQSAQIDMVSGATYTSEGYIRSLQSAIDEANL
jgi:uncharacterized protein with FMN-binding domain